MATRYRLTGRLETGELADLFRGERDGQGVVIKLFHPRTSDLQYARSVADTARLLHAVPDPGIAHVIDIGLIDRRLAVVREGLGRYSLGQALQRLNTKEVLLPPAVALQLVIHLLEVVQQAHRAGVVHGALTPGNVLLTEDGKGVISDFGALTALDAAPELEAAFGARGRSSYRAPELTKGEAPSVASDLYSLGAITYELLTLREAATHAKQLSTRNEVLPPPSRLDRRLNARVDPVVMRALEPTPGRRFKSCGEMAAALREFLSNTGGAPEREALQRFVQQLFPGEVKVDVHGAVPIEGPFELAEVRGADLAEVAERSMVLMARPSFSGGEVDTGEAFPLMAEPGTQPGHPESAGKQTELGLPTFGSLEWDAPPAVEPAGRKLADRAAGANADVLRRVKHVEDFQAPTPGATDTLRELPKVFPGRASAEPSKRQRALPAVEATTPEGRPDDSQGSLHDPDGRISRLLEASSAMESRRRRVGLRDRLTIAAGVVLIGIAAYASVSIWRARGLLPTPAPRPVKVVPAPAAEPQPPRQSPLPKLSTLTEKPPPAPECFAGVPGRTAGFLTLTSPRPAYARIGKELVCGGLPTKLPLPPGKHRLVVIDGKTGEEEPLEVKIETGRQTRLQLPGGKR